MPVPIEIATGLVDAFSNFGDRINPDIARQVFFESAGVSGGFSGGVGASGLDKEPIVVSNETDWNSLNRLAKLYDQAKRKHPNEPYGGINWGFDELEDNQ